VAIFQENTPQGLPFECGYENFPTLKSSKSAIISIEIIDAKWGVFYLIYFPTSYRCSKKYLFFRNAFFYPMKTVYDFEGRWAK